MIKIKNVARSRKCCIVHTHMKDFTTSAQKERFGRILRGEIIDAGMTQSRICAKSGIESSNLSNILAGRKNIGPQTVLAIAEALPKAACRRIVAEYAQTLHLNVFRKHLNRA